MQAPESRNFSVAIIAFAAGIIGHASSLGNKFVWDDIVFFESWSANQQTLTDVFFGQVDSAYHYYRPLLFLTALFDNALWHDVPIGWHLTNLLMHGACAALVTVLVLDLTVDAPVTRTQRAHIATLAGVLFGVGPWNVEAVSWVFARNDLLVTGFVLLGLVTWARWWRRGRRPPVWPALFFLLALLSKETAVAFVPLALLVSLVVPRRASARMHPAFGVLALALAVAVYAALRNAAGIDLSAASNLTSGFSLSLVLRAIGFYATAFVRLDQTPFLESLNPSLAFFGLGAVVASSVATYLLWRHDRPVAAMGLVWFMGGLALPVLSAVNPPSHTVVGYRHLYLPSVGLVIAASMIFHDVISASRIAKAILAVLLVSALGTNLYVNRVWKSDQAYWAHAVKTEPDSHVAHTNLGWAHDDLRQWDDAREAFLGALSRADTTAERVRSVQDLFRVYGATDDHAAAEKLIREQIGAVAGDDPQFSKLLLLLGQVEERKLTASSSRRETNDVRELYRVALRERPYDVEAWVRLAAIDERRGDYILASTSLVSALQRLALQNKDLTATRQKVRDLVDRAKNEPEEARRLYHDAHRKRLTQNPIGAIQSLKAAIALDPNLLVAHLLLAQTRADRGDLAGALETLEAHLNSRPPPAVQAELLTHIAAYRGRMKDHAGAARALGQVVVLDPGDMSAHESLASAYLGMQDPERARAHLSTFVTNFHGDPRRLVKAQITLQGVENKR